MVGGQRPKLFMEKEKFSVIDEVVSMLRRETKKGWPLTALKVALRMCSDILSLFTAVCFCGRTGWSFLVVQSVQGALKRKERLAGP